MNLVDPSCAGLVKAFLMRTRRHPQGSRPSRDPMFRREGSSFDLRNIREYLPSDDPRRVDWRLEARTGRLYVKEYHEEERDGLVVLADLSSSLDALGEVPGARLEAPLADTTAASVAWTLAALGEPVFLLAFASRPLRALERPRGGFGKPELDGFFGDIGREERDGTAIEAAARAARARSRYGRVVIVSDFLDPGFRPERLPFKKAFFLRLHRDFASAAGSAADVDVEDNESGRRLVIPWDGQARKSYLKQLTELEASLASPRGGRFFFQRISAREELPEALYALLEALHA
ncbi:MAG TPA: DUF58 domain-containing protein [Rectinemataceae bacterium]|nr:DUF58 domain-containing protein [Rectinemataceae bacterium]